MGIYYIAKSNLNLKQLKLELSNKKARCEVCSVHP